jgi:hypothetical protein
MLLLWYIKIVLRIVLYYVADLLVYMIASAVLCYSGEL